MKIVRKSRTQTKSFMELDIGDIFVERIDGEDFVQMKIPLLYDEDTGNRFNAILLATGEVCYMTDGIKVECVDATLTIE